MKSDILIAYYSWSGNTRKITELIRRETGGTLFEIEPVQPYTTNYRAAVEQAKDEIEAGFRPELEAMPEITSYTVILLGTPIWWHTMAPPLAAFIDHYNLNAKTVVPFHTHGGGGVGSYEEEKDINNGQSLSPRQQAIIPIAALANMSGTAGQHRFHLGAAMNTGFTEPQMQDIVSVLTAKVGKAEGQSAQKILTEVVNEH